MSHRDLSAAERMLVLLCVPSLLLCIDFAFRFDYILGLPLRNAKYLLLSFLFESSIFASLFLLAGYVKRRAIVAVPLGVLLSFLLMLIYGHYAYFKVLPNVFSIGFSVDNLDNVLIIAGDTMGWPHALGLATGAAALSALAWLSLRLAPRPGLKGLTAALLLTVACGLVVNNNVRFHPSSFTGFTNTAFSVKYYLQKRYFGAKFVLRGGNMQRRFNLRENKTTPNEVNCLLFVAESVRRRNMSYYGYGLETAPFVRSQIDAGRIVVFNRHYANTNSTNFALPMLMSGVFTIEKLNVPYVYDYLKSWAGLHTFFFTSQSMSKSDQHVVYGTSLDAFVYQENSGLPRHCDLGADDFGILTLVDKHLDTAREPFFGVVQLNNTHYPYVSRPEHKKFGSDDANPLNSYDNSLLEMDVIIQAYFDLLRRKGLLERTLIIFISDHGEAFKEHGHSGHLQTLYDEEIAVPLWFHVPESLSARWEPILRANIHTETSHLDLLPTILDLFGILEPAKLSVEVDGRSLLSTLEGSRAIPLVGASLAPMNGFVQKGFKFVRSGEGREHSYELYDLAADPDEKVNLWATTDQQERLSYQTHLKACLPKDKSSPPTVRVADN